MAPLVAMISNGGNDQVHSKPGPPSSVLRVFVFHTLVKAGALDAYEKQKPGFAYSEPGFKLTCRGSEIRTHDLVVPNDARYQAALYPEGCKISIFLYSMKRNRG